MKNLLTLFDELNSGMVRSKLFQMISKHTQSELLKSCLRRLFVQKVAKAELEVISSQIDTML